MPRYSFAISTSDLVREVGHVQSDSFAEALTSIGNQLSAKEGDTLEIGVNGFPPAHFECVWSAEDNSPGWRATDRLAA